MFLLRRLFILAYCLQPVFSTIDGNCWNNIHSNVCCLQSNLDQCFGLNYCIEYGLRKKYKEYCKRVACDYGETTCDSSWINLAINQYNCNEINKIFPINEPQIDITFSFNTGNSTKFSGRVNSTDLLNNYTDNSYLDFFSEAQFPCIMRQSCKIEPVYQSTGRCTSTNYALSDCGVTMVDTIINQREDIPGQGYIKLMPGQLLVDTTKNTFYKQPYIVSCYSSIAPTKNTILISVVCDQNNSPSYTIDTIASRENQPGLDNVQLVDINDKGPFPRTTEYVFDLYNTSIPYCQITGYSIVNQTGGITLRYLRGQYVAVPDDKSLHAIYTFNYQITSNPLGWITKTSDLKTLIVGCTPNMTISLPNFQQTLITDVGQIFDYAIPLATTDLTYCNITLIEIFDVALYDVPNNYSIVLDPACSNPLLCQVGKLDSYNARQNITFKIRYCSYKNCQDTQTLKIFVKCNLAKNAVISSMVTEKTYYLKAPPAKANQNIEIYEFGCFTCQEPACCPLYQDAIEINVLANNTENNKVSGSFGYRIENVPIIGKNADEYKELNVNISDIILNQSYTIPINTTGNFAIKHQFRIIGISAMGQELKSPLINTRIIFKCEDEGLFLINTLPKRQEQYWKKIAGRSSPVFKFKGTVTQNFEPILVDLTDRFRSNDHTGRCFKSNYKIEKIEDYYGQIVDQELWYEKFIMSPEGILTIQDMDKSLYYNVFISVYNGFIWHSFDEYLINFETTFKYIPPFKPRFETIPPKFIYDLDSKNLKEEDELILQLPKVMSIGNQIVKIKVLNYQKLVKYDDKTGNVIFFIGRIKASGLYSVQLMLYDQFGIENSVMVPIQINPKKKKVVVSKFVIQNEKVQLRDINPLSKNLSADITKFSNVGEMEIQFNSSLDLSEGIEFFKNHTSLKLLPANHRNLEEGFDVEKVSFKWTMISFTEDGLMKIKVNFKEPVWISPVIVQDLMEVRFNSNMLLYSPVLQRYLNPGSYNLQISIPKQNPDGGLSQTIMRSSGKTEEIFKTMLILTIIQNCVFSGGMIYMLALIQSLQMLLHWPLFRIVFPGNIGMVFGNIIPFVMFDIIDPEVFQMFLTFDPKAQKEINNKIIGQMQDLGYDTHNSLFNLGTVAIVTMLFIMKIILVGFMYLFSRLRLKWRIKADQMKDKLYGEIILIGREGYIEFLISGYLAVDAGIMSVNGEIISTLLGWFSLFITCFLMPLTLAWILFKPISSYHHPDFKQRYGEFFENISKNNKLKLSYVLIFMVRRVCFVAISIYATHQTLQIISILYVNLAVAIYIGISKPFERQVRNKVEFFNEFIVSAACIHLFIFTDYVNSMQAQFDMGYSILILLFVMILLNIYFVVVNSFNLIKLQTIKNYRKIKSYYDKKQARMILHNNEPVDKIDKPIDKTKGFVQPSFNSKKARVARKQLESIQEVSSVSSFQQIEEKESPKFADWITGMPGSSQIKDESYRIDLNNLSNQRIVKPIYQLKTIKNAQVKQNLKVKTVIQSRFELPSSVMKGHVQNKVKIVGESLNSHNSYTPRFSDQIQSPRSRVINKFLEASSSSSSPQSQQEPPTPFWVKHQRKLGSAKIQINLSSENASDHRVNYVGDPTNELLSVFNNALKQGNKVFEVRTFNQQQFKSDQIYKNSVKQEFKSEEIYKNEFFKKNQTQYLQ